MSAAAEGGGLIQGTPEQRREVRTALFASAVGTSIEWYDYFLYGTAAALVFPKLFFPHSSPEAGTLESFATYAVGFAARPVGAMLFGHLGDRIGRKTTLIATLVLMGLGSTAIGLLPTYQMVGIWGAVLLVVFRILQGLGVGGEWGGAVGLAMEWGHTRKRGFLASWPQFGVPVGLLVANGLTLLFSSLYGNSFVGSSYTAGWRIPFWFSAVLVIVGLYVRLKVVESPLFTEVQARRQVERQPLLEVIKRQPKEILVAAGIRTSEQAPFYIFTSFVLAFGVDHLGRTKDFMLYTVIAAAAVSLLSVPFFGWLSDRVGRRRVYVAGAILTGLFIFPYFWMLETAIPALIVLAVILSLIPHDMQYGPQAAYIAEAFPTKVRYSGAGLGYQLASVSAGGPAPLIATALLPLAVWWIPAYIIGCVVVTLISCVLLPDRTGADLMTDFREKGAVTSATGSPAAGTP
ncbi:MAG TPA: MFS transporter [Streptosporangiaceae bacterium]|nr:MFS transporter [Streptosporangiaceae bacterium]